MDVMKKFLQQKIEKVSFKTENLLELLHLTMKKFPCDPLIILQSMAEYFYIKGEHENCLETLSYYANEIGAFEGDFYKIVANYYRKTIANSENLYTENIKLLRKYPYCCTKELPSFSELENVVLWQNIEKQEYLLLEKSTGIIHWHNEEHNILVEENIYDRNDIFIFHEFMHEKLINDTLKKIKYDKYRLLPGEGRPTYCYYRSNEKLAIALQLGNWQQILELERMIILAGEDKFYEFMDDPQSVPVNQQKHILFSKASEAVKEEFTKKIIEYYNNKKTRSEKLNRENFLYYEQNKQIVKNNIKNGKIKIMFRTTPFSTAVQYHTRDCAEICEKMGLEVLISKEKSPLHQMNYEAIIKNIADFKPDIIFCINHFRKSEIMPANIVAIIWTQDPMSHITDPKSAIMLSKNDYVLAHSPSKKELVDIGYPEKKIMPANIPANHNIYKPYILAEWEKNKYTADIILVANRSSYQTEIELILAKLKDRSPGIEALLRSRLEEYYQGVLREQLFLKDETAVIKYFSEKLGDKATSLDCHEFFLYTRAVAFRSALAEWLIDRGYTNIKLYGNNWAENPKFAPYAMGIAPNGEILSKIYQSAKIVLGSNNQATGNARVYETFLSGGFYISNYIDPQVDVVDIRDRLEENKEIPFFYDKQDLYNKLDYYLAHEDKRAAISKKVRDKMLNIGTYEALMRNMLKWLAEEV